ncbi:caffeine-induced death protein-like protein Cid2 [Glonium stellatum]|uniref:Caffeine-induced death protein-like protein Cid2 n=1 Tax=Glonium stellatum TaxID=574774 RepID=A0A8E2EMU3_9PEZI|nr:caffeine-induced death protein-like protein Cid2 [Glonium stellatum]
MSRPLERPRLTPQFCFNQTALRDFLRLSRGSIDDSIIQNLNALVTPASEGFDPSSTSLRQVRAPYARLIDPQSCQKFKDKVIFPSWQARSDVLNYCAGVATSPDPDDPDSVLLQVESAKARERVIDERLDPYSGRYFPREARTEILANLIRNERSIEGIIRSRTWALVGERCADPLITADDALDEWRARKLT